MDVRYLILILFFLASCMPTAQVSRGDLSDAANTGGTTSGPISDSPVTWNYLGALTGFITINVSNLNNAYVVGTPVENYLSNNENFDNANYCLVSRYNLGGVVHELRSRIVPISYFDFKLKRIVKNMRVDFQDVTNSQSLCADTLRVMNTAGTNYVFDPDSPSSSFRHFSTSAICTTCTSMLIAKSVAIYKKVKVDPATSYLDKVAITSINTDKLAMQIDPNYSTNGSAGTCTKSECVSRGFDCCLENQCVKDGATKPAAYTTQYSSIYQTAQQERLQNPLAYLNYPQIYYICGSSVPTTSGGSGGGSTGGGYESAFNLLKKDYKCVEHLKSQATTNPFHTELLSRTYTGTTDCLTNSTESSFEMYYKTVVERLYKTCGCNRTNLQDMISNCPAYDYTVVRKDSAGEPTQIDCYTPPTNPTTPSQQSVSVSSRSAPHRYFESSGEEKDIASGVVQEGPKFEYLDDGKVLPSQQNFSMNAILGQMSVSLDQALPAKTVNVQYDQVYFLSTTSGYYTPCPSCSKDSWLSSFSAFPSTSTGTGLQAIGHTTQRDAFSTNTTAGNYEDTIFGRACWLPPTMIPYSHSPKTSVQTQRLNRLETQAALFVNGYQRDWFGFNKGALIGSFDGVTWFAIGKGRIVRSTSKKLFLAINAPFADVASPTMHVVNVHAYDGITQAAQVDYDPEYHQYHPYQNEAGNCQKNHFCSTDTDCVTKLGWEYACADVRELKTKWPEFDSEGNEKAFTSKTVTLDQILQQKRFPSGSTKRCVYRGAGAICHNNPATLPATDLNKRKLLTCGPNFFCSNVTASGFHNNKIARYAARLDEIPVSRNHYFGKDANILGRPLNYNGDSALTSTISSTIAENLVPFESTASSYTGLCQPGKNLPTSSNEASLSNPFNQHLSGDNLRRSDYINQIATCNPTLFTTNRHSSCPVIGSDGNYELFSSGTLPSGYSARATNQNACGLESLLSTASLGSTADTLQSSSPFKTIEARPLNAQVIVEPTLARDACLRRAGAVCHTDLDCSPNKMHASQVDFYSLSYFGNSAEKSYHTEYLVCGQADPKPFSSNTEAFKNYDMSKNVCCREIGKDLTTYTADLPQETYVNLSTKPYDPASAGLLMSLAPGIAPNNPKRYSRLATVEGVGTTKPILTANQDRVGNALDNTKPNVMTKDQWKTISEANSESCCGGGWIRKFSDGSNDWTRRNRVVLDVTNFRCINSRTPLITTPSDLAAQYNNAADVEALVGQDYGDYCKDSTNLNGACAQYSVKDTALDYLPSPAGVSYTTTTINTIKPVYTVTGNPDNYFMPRSADSNSNVIIDFADTSSNRRRNISIKLPSFVTRQFDADYAATANGASSGSIPIRMVRDDGVGITCQKLSTYNPTQPADDTLGGGAQVCRYSYNTTTRILKVGATTPPPGGNFELRKVGIEFTVNTPGQGLASITRTKPGSNAYYLKRLGRLELSGIPQITYEVLTCNDNANRVVQGIFDFGINFLTDFNNNNYSFEHTYDAKDPNGNTVSTTQRFTNAYGLQHEPVFSQNDFKCCSPLGKTVTNASVCCSGYGIATSSGSNDKTCALPPGTDLMVYFNRFVSNEGRGTKAPGGGLVDNDFDAQTGEPLIVSSVNDKIRALGGAYCASGRVRQGGAFGSFEVEPQGSQTNVSERIYNIVDSSRDIGQSSNAGTTNITGYPAFSDGFRWNHHLYCDD